MDLISDEMSRRIIAAAEQIARTSGAESVTVRSILRALGISNRVFTTASTTPPKCWTLCTPTPS